MAQLQCCYLCLLITNIVALCCLLAACICVGVVLHWQGGRQCRAILHPRPVHWLAAQLAAQPVVSDGIAPTCLPRCTGQQ